MTEKYVVNEFIDNLNLLVVKRRMPFGLREEQVAFNLMAEVAGGPWYFSQLSSGVIALAQEYRNGGGITYLMGFEGGMDVFMSYMPSKGQGIAELYQLTDEYAAKVTDFVRYNFDWVTLEDTLIETRLGVPIKSYPWGGLSLTPTELLRHGHVTYDRGTFWTRATRLVSTDLPWWVDTHESPDAKAFRIPEGTLVVFDPDSEKPVVRLVPYGEELHAQFGYSLKGRQGDFLAWKIPSLNGFLSTHQVTDAGHNVDRHRIDVVGKVWCTVIDDHQFFVTMGNTTITHPEHEPLELGEGAFVMTLEPGTSTPFSDAGGD